MLDFDEWLKQPIAGNEQERNQLREHFGIKTKDDWEDLIDDVDDFEIKYANNAGCLCGIHPPPCSYCTHPGNYETNDDLRRLLELEGYFDD